MPSPRAYSAAWILPVAAPPIRNGYVEVADDRIVAVGEGEPLGALPLGNVAIMPALVNAHTHLELSYLHERIPPSEDFTSWIMSVMGIRRGYPDPADAEIVAAAERAIAGARAWGTGLFGDISNTLITVALLRDAGVAAHVFYELLGFNHPDPDGRVREAREAARKAGVDAGGVRVSIAPHAPYSASPSLFAAIRRDLDEHPPGISSVHLGESPTEVELLRSGRGPMREMLETLGAWSADWRVPGLSPVEYLSELGFLDSRVIVVHGVQLDGDDLRRLASIGATLVSCPRSNRHVGVGSPPLEAFYAMDVDVAFGTDSLASVADLNMFAELAEARRIAPRVTARRLIESATLVGARALGFERDFGSIEAGKRASLLTIALPARVPDVEEYVVSGVPAGSVRWLGDLAA